MIWKQPHIAKVYEALTAIADKRIKLDPKNPNVAYCASSSRGKEYTVEYDPETGAMMSNDNSAFYTDMLSYPMIALLMLKGRIEFDDNLPESLRGIYWKQLNQKFRNDYDEAINYALNELKEKGEDVAKIRLKVEEIYKVVKTLKVGVLGKKKRPPAGY